MKDNTNVESLRFTLKFAITDEQVEKNSTCAATWNETLVLHIIWVKCLHVKPITLKNIETPLHVSIYKHVFIQGFYIFFEQWHFRRPKVKLRLGHKLFCLMAYICLNSRGKASPIKTEKTGQQAVGLAAIIVVPGTRRCSQWRFHGE